MYIPKMVAIIGLLCTSIAQDAVSQPKDGAVQTAAAEPVVARQAMKLTLKKELLDTIEAGDLLTVLTERENDYVIRTFNGHKGAIAKDNVAKLAESVPVYDKLIAQRPGDGRLHTLRASAHWAAGDSEKALADYDQAIELGYTEAHAYSSRGMFHIALGNRELAIADFSTAIEKGAADEVPLLNRASVYMGLQKYQLAIDDYSAAAKIRPDNPTLYIQRAIARKLLGKLEAAIDDYDRAIALAERDVSAWMGRGYLKFQLSRHAEAIEDFSHAIELAPQSAVAFNNRGYNYQLLGEEASALSDYKRAVELAPKYLLAMQNKAWLLTTAENEALRNPDEAVKVATAVCETTEYQNASDVTLLAAAYASAEEFETAIGWQEKAIELAAESQKQVAKEILQLYQNKQPLDPSLLEGADSLLEAADKDQPALPASGKP
ncbi:MAG: tetratricopeptide repeat protein [Planctomycetales bacterium]|nr:tetratricopeptide repeat protein [Planctomycetales bacterium]